MQELTSPCCCTCIDGTLQRDRLHLLPAKPFPTAPYAHHLLPTDCLLQVPMTQPPNSTGWPLPLWGRRKMTSTRRAPTPPCPPASQQSTKPTQSGSQLHQFKKRPLLRATAQGPIQLQLAMQLLGPQPPLLT